MLNKNFKDIKIKQNIKKTFHFSQQKVEIFSKLVDDYAPIHHDVSFAKKKGLKKNIVHGFFLSSVFSGMLGEKLPGPNSVINTISLKFHKKVFVGQKIFFKVKVTRLTPSVRVVNLELEGKDKNKILYVSGEALCSFA